MDDDILGSLKKTKPKSPLNKTAPVASIKPASKPISKLGSQAGKKTFDIDDIMGGGDDGLDSILSRMYIYVQSQHVCYYR